MTQQELDEIIQDSNRNGTRIMLPCRALVGLSMRGADMRGANMREADMRWVNMQEANMRGADIDYAGWPLWCGSLRAYIDDRIAIQLLYHVLSPVCYSPYVSDEIKRALLTPELVAIANRFHRVAMGDCNELPTYKAT